MELEIDDQLKSRAEEAFAQYGITHEQGLLMMIEEFVSAQGEMVHAAKELRDRLSRIAR